MLTPETEDDHDPIPLPLFVDWFFRIFFIHFHSGMDFSTTWKDNVVQHGAELGQRLKATHPCLVKACSSTAYDCSSSLAPYMCVDADCRQLGAVPALAAR